jgi:hypothetical protein
MGSIHVSMKSRSAYGSEMRKFTRDCAWLWCPAQRSWALLPIDLMLIVFCFGHADFSSSHPARDVLIDAWLCAFAWRLGLTVHSLVHEWGHLSVGRWLRVEVDASRMMNLLGNRPILCHLVALFPFAPEASAPLFVQVRPESELDDSRIRRSGFVVGLVFSLLLVGGLAWLPLSRNFLLASYLGALLAHGGASLTDLASFTTYPRRFGLMACGNVTLMAKTLATETAALPDRLRIVLQRMLAISQMRGAQAGGGRCARCASRSARPPRQKASQRKA